MEMKEVVNLRKLRELYNEDSFSCEVCPFRDACNNAEQCIAESILGIKADETKGIDSEFDLYDMQKNGTLTEDYQIPLGIC